MTDLNEMWNALERYQPYADKAGHGKSWKRMTTERKVRLTEIAADVAMSSWAASAAVLASWAVYTSEYTPDAEAAERYATQATEYINEAMEVK